jgi:hypothetical protein
MNFAAKASAPALKRLFLDCIFAFRLVDSSIMSEVTRILSDIEQGDPHAAEKLLPLVYDELRKLAAQRLANENPGQTTSNTQCGLWWIAVQRTSKEKEATTKRSGTVGMFFLVVCNLLFDDHAIVQGIAFGGRQAGKEFF